MEQALRAAYGSQSIWHVVPAEPEGTLESLSAYHHVFELLFTFTKLWSREPYFLAAEPEHHSISTDLAAQAAMTLSVYNQEHPSTEQTGKLRELWEGPVDNYHPLAGLLENHHWRSTPRRPDGILKCSRLAWYKRQIPLPTICSNFLGDIIESKVRQVYRRMVAAPKLPLSEAQLKACAAVWLAYEQGMNNLTRWQRAVVSHSARLAGIGVPRVHGQDSVTFWSPLSADPLLTSIACFLHTFTCPDCSQSSRSLSRKCLSFSLKEAVPLRHAKSVSYTAPKSSRCPRGIAYGIP